MPNPHVGVFIGVGLTSGASQAEVHRLVAATLSAGGVPWSSVGAVATIDKLGSDPRLIALGRPVLGFSPGRLAAELRAEPSDRCLGAIGVPSVAEAAALLAAGPRGRLIVAKQRGRRVTVAVAVP